MIDGDGSIRYNQQSVRLHLANSVRGAHKAFSDYVKHLAGYESSFYDYEGRNYYESCLFGQEAYNVINHIYKYISEVPSIDRKREYYQNTLLEDDRYEVEIIGTKLPGGKKLFC